MAITYEGAAGTATLTADPSVTVTHGISIQSGDLVLAAVNSNKTSATITSDATYSFTEATGFPLSGGTRTSTISLFYRVAAGSETSYTFGHGSGSDRLAASVAVFRGVDTGTPFSVAPDAANVNYVQICTHFELISHWSGMRILMWSLLQI